MTAVAGTAPDQAPSGSGLSARRLLAATEIDLRLFGMLVALAAILIGFHVASGEKFLLPVNMMTLAVQASTVAIMATGMVLIIVARNIDLSVGSIVGVLAMVYALLMSDWLPHLVGIPVDSPFMWVIALALGLGLGAVIGGFQGFVIAYIGVPSFVVTLGGLLALRGITWLLSEGAAVAGLDRTFLLIGGGLIPGAIGTIGGTWTWAVGAVGAVGIVALLVYNRRQRQRFGFPLRPVWADVLLAVIGCLAVIGLAAFANANVWPAGLASQYAAEHGIIEPPGGLKIAVGFPWPVLLVIGIAIAMTILATRLRFGRSVYAYGGNPEAAELAGINTRWTIMKLYMLMGLLAGVAAAIAAARLNGATLEVGQSDELYVIAACVVGGTSFAGGIGTVTGAVLGAIVLASLDYGLAFQGVDSPVRNVVAGAVLIVAVAFDSWNRRRAR